MSDPGVCATHGPKNEVFPGEYVCGGCLSGQIRTDRVATEIRSTRRTWQPKQARRANRSSGRAR